MKRVLWSLIAFAGIVFAQENKTQPGDVSKLIQVHYVSPSRIWGLMTDPKGVSGFPGVSIRADNELQALLVSGRPDAVDAVEAIVKKLDVRPMNIELTVYLVSGTAQGSTDELPKELASTARQLHGLFSYKSYRLLDSFVLRVSSGGSSIGQSFETSGVVPNIGPYNFRFLSATVSNGTPRTVHLNSMSLQYRIPISEKPFTSVGINTDIDVAEGQQVVVGKSSLNDTALILVITAKVVE